MAEQPAVSVVIPVLNGASVVAGAIDSALNQDYAGPLDVVVAVGPGSDDTKQVVDDLASADPRVTAVPNPTGNTSAGLNAAIQAATGSVIVRCDAQARLPAGYVARAVALLAETGADNVGGVQAATGTRFMQRAVAIAQSHPLGVGDARYRTGGDPGEVDTVYLGVFRREALERVHGFDETLVRNQDYELNWRIRQTGGTVYFHPELRVEYFPRSRLQDLWRQYFQYGTWKRETVRRHPGSLRWRQLVAPALVAALVASLVLSVTPLALWSVVVPGLYIVALIGTALLEAIRRRSLAALALPFVLPTIHMAWGTGFLFGRAQHPR